MKTFTDFTEKNVWKPKMNHLGLDSESYLKSVISSEMQQYMMHQRCLSGFRQIVINYKEPRCHYTASIFTVGLRI